MAPVFTSLLAPYVVLAQTLTQHGTRFAARSGAWSWAWGWGWFWFIVLAIVFVFFLIAGVGRPRRRPPSSLGS